MFLEPLLPTCRISVTNCQWQWPQGRSSLGSVPNGWSFEIYSQIASRGLREFLLDLFPSLFLSAIGLMSLAASLEFAAHVRVSPYPWIWKWWRGKFSCSTFDSICCKQGSLVGFLSVSIIFLWDALGYWSSIELLNFCILLAWDLSILWLEFSNCRSEYNIMQIDLFSPV